MTTTPAAPTPAFLDGWQGAVDEMRRQFTHEENHCWSCALVRVQFAGIIASLGAGDAEPGQASNYISSRSGEQLIRTAMSDDLEERATVLAQARHLVQRQPAAASDVLVQFALGLAQHYGASSVHELMVDEDGAVERVLPASEWG